MIDSDFDFDVEAAVQVLPEDQRAEHFAIFTYMDNGLGWICLCTWLGRCHGVAESAVINFQVERATELRDESFRRSKELERKGLRALLN